MCITQPLLSLKLGKMCTEYSPVLGHSYSSSRSASFSNRSAKVPQLEELLVDFLYASGSNHIYQSRQLNKGNRSNKRVNLANPHGLDLQEIGS